MTCSRSIPTLFNIDSGEPMNSIYAVTTEPVVGVTAIRIAGRIRERVGTPITTDALDYEGAKFLAKCLALATGSAVHITYTNGDGEHNLKAHPDHFPHEGPGALDRAFLLSSLPK
jgi:hypothetical protein